MRDLEEFEIIRTMDTQDRFQPMITRWLPCLKLGKNDLGPRGFFGIIRLAAIMQFQCRLMAKLTGIEISNDRALSGAFLNMTRPLQVRKQRVALCNIGRDGSPRRDLISSYSVIDADRHHRRRNHAPKRRRLVTRALHR